MSIVWLNQVQMETRSETNPIRHENENTEGARTIEDIDEMFDRGETPDLNLIMNASRQYILSLANKFLTEYKIPKYVAEDGDVMGMVCIKLNQSFANGSFFSKREKGGKFSTWLYTLIRNTALDIARKNSRKEEIIKTGRAFEIQIEETPNKYNENTLPDIGNPTVESARYFDWNDYPDIDPYLALELNNIKEENRIPLVLYIVFRKTYEEIGKLMNIKLGTVKSRINRARGLIRQRLGEDFM